jgi:hypothetical protein
MAILVRQRSPETALGHSSRDFIKMDLARNLGNTSIMLDRRTEIFILHYPRRRFDGASRRAAGAQHAGTTPLILLGVDVGIHPFPKSQPDAIRSKTGRIRALFWLTQ